MQAGGRDKLRELLDRASGGIIVTTIHKFGYPADKRPDPLVITNRRNVIVMADEAHRSQYGLIDGLAAQMREALPGATYLRFTGTPIDEADRSTLGCLRRLHQHLYPRSSPSRIRPRSRSSTKAAWPRSDSPRKPRRHSTRRSPI